MTHDELENNLGTIAKSGSLAFKKEQEIKDGHDIIGQFGVGFYAAFMVAEEVQVISRSVDEQKAYLWTSNGTDGFTIEETSKDEIGTKIILTLKEDTEEETYEDYLDEHRLQSIIKKYSDFIGYPIKMNVTVSQPKSDDSDEMEEVEELQTINSMVPIWRKNKAELKEEDYTQFYKDKRYGFDTPLDHVHISVDGAVRYNAILYILSLHHLIITQRNLRKGWSFTPTECSLWRNAATFCLITLALSKGWLTLKICHSTSRERCCNTIDN